MLSLKVARLVLGPNKSSVFGKGGMGTETVDIAYFGDDAGGVDLANAGNENQGVRDDLKLLLSCFLQHFDLLIQGADGSDGD